jgi:hypothetical protein
MQLGRTLGHWGRSRQMYVHRGLFVALFQLSAISQERFEMKWLGKRTTYYQAAKRKPQHHWTLSAWRGTLQRECSRFWIDHMLSKDDKFSRPILIQLARVPIDVQYKILGSTNIEIDVVKCKIREAIASRRNVDNPSMRSSSDDIRK